jgi:PmbA protein
LKLKDAVEYMYSKARSAGLQKFDIIAGISESTGLEIFEKKIQNTEINSGTGIGIRLFKDGRPGISYTEKFSPFAINQALQDAISNSEITDPIDLDLPTKSTIPDLDLKSFEPNLSSIEFQNMVELGLELEEIAKGLDSRVENIPYLGVGKSESEFVLRNSNGVDYGKKSNSISAYLGITASFQNQKKMGVYSNSYRSFQDFNSNYMAKKAVERALELLGAKPIQSGKYPIVFSNRISGSILGMFFSVFSAEMVQKGQSRLKGKLHTKIASELLTINCDPHIPGMPGSKYLDSEGVLTAKMEIIKDGVLQAYLYNLETSKKDNVKPTGHGSRSYSGKAGVSFSNLIIERTNKSLHDLLSSYPKVFYVTKLEGSSGCSALSGDISIGVQGFLYENGQMTTPVDKVTLSGNFFQLIESIEGFSNEYNDSYTSIKIPDFLVSSMAIAG